MSQSVRIALGCAVLAVLIWVGLRLLPSYLGFVRYQQALEHLMARSETPARPADWIRGHALNEAGRLGLPVRISDVHVVRVGERWRVEVQYRIAVDFGLYTVDLHFRPRAGA